MQGGITVGKGNSGEVMKERKLCVDEMLPVNVILVGSQKASYTRRGFKTAIHESLIRICPHWKTKASWRFGIENPRGHKKFPKTVDPQATAFTIDMLFCDSLGQLSMVVLSHC